MRHNDLVLLLALAGVVFFACSPRTTLAPHPVFLGLSDAKSGTSHDARKSQWQVIQVDSGGLPIEPVDFTPDWSGAGYRLGSALPQKSATHSVLDFGAIADDGGDDTEAFVRALTTLEAEKGEVVLSIPPGVFELSEILYLKRGDFVLKGAGSDRSILRFSRPLSEMKVPGRIESLRRYLVQNDKRAGEDYFSSFSWTGGVIWSRLPQADEIALDGSGEFLDVPVTALVGERGAREFRVGSKHDFKVGETLVLRWYNDGGPHSEFLQHVYGRELPGLSGRLSDDPERVLVEQVLTVKGLEGGRISFQQPLLHDLRKGFKVRLGRVLHLEELGVEGLTVRFPDVPYAGHHQAAGYNALYLNDLLNSWIRDVVIENADAGVLSDRSSHVTLKGVKVRGRAGHYGIHLGSVYGFLVTDFDVAPHFVHSLSFNTRCRGSVFHRGTIRDGSLDQHRGMNHQNLYDSIVAIESDDQSELFKHGGAGYWGPTHGAFNTLWNVQLRFLGDGLSSDTTISLGEVAKAGPARLKGVRSNRPAKVVYPGAVSLPDEGPESLYLAQRCREIGGSSRTSAANLSARSCESEPPSP